jgi:PAS domain-containing protein
MAFAGKEEGYLREAAITWEDNEHGQGPAGTAVRTRKPAWIKNILKDQRFTPWRARAIARGYASSLALPLIRGNDSFGVLSLYSAEPEKFSQQTFEQYVELADNLAYGIASLRAQEDRNQAEAALRRSQAYLAEGQRLTHMGSWAVNATRQDIVYWSDEQYRLYGFDRKIGLPTFTALLKRIHPEDRPQIQKRVKDSLAGKHDLEGITYRVVLPDGTMKFLRSIADPVVNEAGEVELVGASVDVSEQKRADALLSAEKQILEMIASGAELQGVLQSLCDSVDKQAHNVISTVLLMDPDGKRLWPAAWPRVPEGWSKRVTPCRSVRTSDPAARPPSGNNR